MKLDFTVWTQHGMAPDLFSTEDLHRHLDMELTDVVMRISVAELPLSPTEQVHLFFGASSNWAHRSAVLTTSLDSQYAYVTSGAYADMLSVWRSYALMLHARSAT